MTAKQLIEKRTGETRSGDYTSEINGHLYIWNYRTSYNPDGTRQSFGRTTLCRPNAADCIMTECGLILGL